MGNDLNRCEFIGHLGRDPEMKYTPSGVACANFSLAVGEKYKSHEQWVENTEWVKCVAWRKLAEICGQYLGKGSQVYVAGKLKTRSWEGKDGTKKYMTEVVLDNMQMLGGKSEPKQTQNEEPPDDGDIPF